MTVDPYREMTITREAHERELAELRTQLAAAQRELDSAQEASLRKQGAVDALRAACTWMTKGQGWYRQRRGYDLDAGLFLIWVLRAVHLSKDGKSFDIEAGRLQR